MDIEVQVNSVSGPSAPAGIVTSSLGQSQSTSSAAPSLYGNGNGMNIMGMVAPSVADHMLIDSSASNTPRANTPVQIPSAVPAKPLITTLQKKVALPKYQQLRLRIEKFRYDVEAWKELGEDVRPKGLEKNREYFEELLTVWPTSYPYWVQYANLELQNGEKQAVEQIFTRTLRFSPSIALWRFYLNYVRRFNPLSNPNSRKVISDSFEYCLNYIGQDYESTDVWREYITFLKDTPASNSASGETWEEQQKMDAIRKAYQRAVAVPMKDVEGMWRDYNNFEMQVNKMTAKKFLQERSNYYMTARRVIRDLKTLLDRLYTPDLPIPPDLEHNDGDREALEAWKDYLKWEETNPLEFEDAQTLYNRVTFVYKQAVVFMRFYPEIWYMAAMYTIQHGKKEKTDEAIQLLKWGIEANPSSLLLHYTYISILESKKQVTEVYALFDNLVQSLTVQLDDLNQGMEAEVAEKLGENEDLKPSEKEEKKEEVQRLWKQRMQPVKERLGNVWIMQIRFAMRAEGMKQARMIFGKARKSKQAYLSWQVYEAAALTEYHWNKEVKVSSNIFELGMKHYGDDVAFAVRYLDFLIWVNDTSNARALFEKTVAKITDPVKARPMWERWAQYEYQYGDLNAILKLDERWAEMFPDDPFITQFARRFTYQGLENFLTQEVGTSALALMQPTNSTLSSNNLQSPTVDQQQLRHRVQNLKVADDRIGSSPLVQQQQQGGTPVRRPRDERERRSASPPRDRDNRGQRGRPVSPIPHREEGGDMPSGLLYFMSKLPNAESFNGPILNAQIVMEILAATQLPTSFPGHPPPSATQGSQYYGSSLAAGAGRRSLSPPLRRGGAGRNRSPDYGEYRGPGTAAAVPPAGGAGGRRGRRY